MKFAVAFLFLGCLVSLNANVIRQKKMKQGEAMGHARSLGLIMGRYSKLKNCVRCSDLERYCMEKAIVEDLCMLMKIMAGDMGCHYRELVAKLNFGIRVEYFYVAIENGDVELLAKDIKNRGLIDAFVKAVSGLMVTPLKESNVELGSVLVGVNNAVGGILEGGLKVVSGVVGGAIGGLLGTATGILDGVVGTVHHAVGGAVNGAAGAIGNVAGNLVGSATGVLGGNLLG